MPFSNDELDALRAESLAHRMDTERVLVVERKKQAVRRLLALGTTLVLASIALFLVTTKDWGGLVGFIID